jgi:trans-aconitate methyltransferase
MRTLRLSSFDEAYFKKFYGAGKKSVRSAADVAPQARMVDALCESWGLTLRSMLEVGAGPGFWRAWFSKSRPEVRVLSTDISEYACEKYGHELRDISKWKPARAFDLVICQDVLQYLSDRDAAAAIRNLASATREVLFLELPTHDDLKSVLDREATDFQMNLRPAEWYRRRLRRFFRQVGAGVWVRRGGRVVLYAMEAAD